MMILAAIPIVLYNGEKAVACGISFIFSIQLTLLFLQLLVSSCNVNYFLLDDCLKTVYNATCKQIVQITRKLRVEREAVSILIETASILRKMKTIEVIKWNKNVRLFPPF